MAISRYGQHLLLREAVQHLTHMRGEDLWKYETLDTPPITPSCYYQHYTGVSGTEQCFNKLRLHSW